MAEQLGTKDGVKKKGWFARHKVLAILLLLLLLGIGFVVYKVRSAMAQTSATAYQFVRTTTLAKTSLDDSVSVSGTVKSGQSASVTVSEGAKTYKVASVRVAVGDTVRKGDVIATLDTADVEQSIASAQQDYDDSLQKAQTTYARAKESYEVELVKHQNDMIDLQEEIDKAQQNLDEITKNYENLSGDYTGDAANYEKVEYYYNLYRDRIGDQQNVVSNKETLYYELLNSNGDKDEATLDAKADWDDAKNQLTILKNQCSAPELGLFTFDEIEKAYQNVDSLQSSLEKAHDNYDDTKNYPSSLKNAYTSLLDATTSLAQATRPSTKLTDLQTTLEACTLTATMDGTITTLNATVGSACTGVVATIQDVDDLTVEVTIPAANVSKLKPGMECIVTSDATGATEISATLTRIDPVANESGTFGATVSVYGDKSNLLIGIQAKVKIIVSNVSDVWTVPYDAIGTEEDGSQYVLRQSGGSGVDMTFEKVPVTVGESNDYYVQISGDTLADGDVIRSSSDLTQGIESTTDDQSQMMMMMGGPGANVSGTRGNGGARENGGNMGGGNMGGAPGGA